MKKLLFSLTLLLSIGGLIYSRNNIKNVIAKEIKNNNKKAILVVSFGTSYQETRDKTIGAIEKQIKEAYPDYDIKRAFTSETIIKKLKERDKINIDNVLEAMEKLKKEEYKTVICQPTHIINGIEYDKMVSQVNKFKKSFDKIKFGNPLLSTDEDYNKIVKAMNEENKNISNNKAIIFMGHGTSHFANSAYAALDYRFKAYGKNNIFIGTIEGYPDIDTVLKQMKQSNIKKIILMPFMIVAGDHALNDMSGKENNSWKNIFESEGFKVETIIKGLGEYESIRNIFVEHVKNAIESV